MIERFLGTLALAATTAAPQTFLPGDFRDARSCATHETKLVPPVPEALGSFGQGLALDGDTLLVGEPNHDSAGVDAGLVHVYERVAGGFVHQGTLLPADAGADHRFGWSLAARAGRLVVGAWGDATLAVERGSAYVFERTRGGWIETARLAPPPEVDTRGFGWQVALDGDRIAVGSPFESGVEGRVYVYERDAGGAWLETARLASPGAYGGEIFGASLALEGDRLAVGGPYLGLQYVIGHAYVFGHDAGTWTLEASLVGFPIERDRFGSSVALAGDRLFVGSPRDSVPPWGLGFVFDRTQDGGVPTWTNVDSFLAPSPDTHDGFGARVAVDGDLLAISAIHARLQGEVILYDVAADGSASERCTIAPSDGDEYDSFGAGLLLQNGTLVVGAPQHDLGAADAGAVYLYDL